MALLKRMDWATNDMSWEKCNNCDFIMEITDHGGITYLCKITGNKLHLKNCILKEEEE